MMAIPISYLPSKTCVFVYIKLMENRYAASKSYTNTLISTPWTVEQLYVSIVYKSVY